MTTELACSALLSSEVVSTIASAATDLDQGNSDTRAHVELVARDGLLGLGAPDNHGAALPAMASVIAELASHCLSTAFSVWAHRMTIEYLAAAATSWSSHTVTTLIDGTVLGVTGMASAFKDAAGCGSLDLAAHPADGGYRLGGTLRWASNLYPDSLMVTAAQTDSGEKVVLAVPLDTEGVAIGTRFDLLALGSTASSSVTIDDAHVSEDHILSRDITAFLDAVRPTFLVLQSAMCVGLARRCLAEVGPSLSGVNSAFTAQLELLTTELVAVESQLTSFAAAVGGPAAPTKRELLTLRLASADIVGAAAALEIRTAGGKGYARRTDASRRFREAAFIPVQSPSEAQLRWELGAGR